MELIGKLSGIVLVAALLALTIRRHAPDLALLTAILGCVLAASLVVSLLRPILDYGKALANKAALDSALTGPLFKALGIALLTQVTSAICADAGQSALAKMAELGGGLLCLFAALPLLEAVLSLIEALL